MTNKLNHPIRIGLSGASGRMGQSIANLVSSEKQFQISARYDSRSSLEKWNPSSLSAVIDFSLPHVLSSVLEWCQHNKKPLVSGTTGLTLEEHQKIKQASSVIPLLWAPNTSLGIACLNEWLKTLPQALKNWNIQIEETHHQFKKDKPSGTALFLQQTLKNKGIETPEPQSIRKGDVKGIHEVFLESPEEILSLKHTALDRKVFARGALKAVEWIIHQKPGLYSIKDCL